MVLRPISMGDECAEKFLPKFCFLSLTNWIFQPLKGVMAIPRYVFFPSDPRVFLLAPFVWNTTSFMAHETKLFAFPPPFLRMFVKISGQWSLYLRKKPDNRIKTLFPPTILVPLDRRGQHHLFSLHHRMTDEITR